MVDEVKKFNILSESKIIHFNTLKDHSVQLWKSVDSGIESRSSRMLLLLCHLYDPVLCYRNLDVFHKEGVNRHFVAIL